MFDKIIPRLAAEAILLFILAVGLVVNRVSALKHVTSLYQYRESIEDDQRVRWYRNGYNRGQLLIWSYFAVVELLLFSFCIKFWLHQYRVAQEGSAENQLLKEEPLMATTWVVNARLLFA